MGALIYMLMLIFDFSLIAGTVYLIQKYNWSPWWFLLTLFIISDLKNRRK